MAENWNAEALKTQIENSVLRQIQRARIQLCDAEGVALLVIELPSPVQAGDTITFTVPTRLDVS